MRALVFSPQRDTPGKGDAREFTSEAHAFCRVNGLRDQVFIFDNHDDYAHRRERLLSELNDMAHVGTKLDVLALFCHGWPTGVQMGFTIQDIPKMVSALKAVSSPSLIVALYCCSTGEDGIAATDDLVMSIGGDGGFADRLRDALCDNGINATVFAHAIEGHCTRNPNVRVFSPDSRNGGAWLVKPHGDLWLKWLRALHSTDLRLRFPLLTREQVEAWLHAEP